MEKKYQVFISSTYEDLIEERKEVVQGVLESNCIPAGMELFPASNKSQWEVIKSVIDDCDYYLLIIAGRYGSEGTDDYGKHISYTEMEFDYAVKTKKPIIALIHKHPEQIISKYTEVSAHGHTKLQQFKKKAMEGRLVDFWDNKDNLKTAVIKSLMRIIITSPTAGWIKCSNTNYRDSNSNDTKCAVIKAAVLEDAQSVIEKLVDCKVVYLNIESAETDVAQRIVDIVSGALYIVGGNLQKVSNGSFMLSLVELESDSDEILSNFEIEPEPNQTSKMRYYINDSCMKCGECKNVCPAGAISKGKGKYVINQNICVTCGICQACCPIDAVDNLNV